MTSGEWKKLCKGCRYYRSTASPTSLCFCHYYLDTGHLRGPQKPGQCDKKEIGRKHKIVRPTMGNKKPKITYEDM